MHVGPLPDPETMALYGEIDSTYPDRIMRMAEKNLEARNDAISESARSIAFVTRAGGMTVVVLPVLLLAAAVVLFAMGAPSQVVIAGLIGASLTGVAKVIQAARGGSDGDEDS